MTVTEALLKYWVDNTGYGQNIKYGAGRMLDIEKRDGKEYKLYKYFTQYQSGATVWVSPDGEDSVLVTTNLISVSIQSKEG